MEGGEEIRYGLGASIPAAKPVRDYSHFLAFFDPFWGSETRCALGLNRPPDFGFGARDPVFSEVFP
jgi:hypothetical protein